MYIIKTNKRIIILTFGVLIVALGLSLIFEFQCTNIAHIPYCINLLLGIVASCIVSLLSAYISYKYYYNKIYKSSSVYLNFLLSDFTIIKSLKNCNDANEIKKYFNAFYLHIKELYDEGCDFYPLTYKPQKSNLLLRLRKPTFNFYFDVRTDLTHINEYNEEKLKELVAKILAVIEEYENDFKTLSEDFLKINGTLKKSNKKKNNADDLNDYKHKW